MWRSLLLLLLHNATIGPSTFNSNRANITSISTSSRDTEVLVPLEVNYLEKGATLGQIPVASQNHGFRASQSLAVHKKKYVRKGIIYTSLACVIRVYNSAAIFNI